MRLGGCDVSVVLSGRVLSTSGPAAIRNRARRALQGALGLAAGDIPSQPARQCTASAIGSTESCRAVADLENPKNIQEKQALRRALRILPLFPSHPPKNRIKGSRQIQHFSRLSRTASPDYPGLYMIAACKFVYSRSDRNRTACGRVGRAGPDHNSSRRIRLPMNAKRNSFTGQTVRRRYRAPDQVVSVWLQAKRRRMASRARRGWPASLFHLVAPGSRLNTNSSPFGSWNVAGYRTLLM
jgi:hypothetical protein